MKKQTLLEISQGLTLIAQALQSEANGTVGASQVEVPSEEPINAPDVPVHVSAVANIDAEETEEGYSIAELKAMKVKDLKEIADELGVKVPDKAKKDIIVDLIMEAHAESADEEEDDEEEPEAVEEPETEAEDDEEEGLTVDDLDEMKLKELKDLADEYEVEYPAKVKATALRILLTEQLFEEEEEEAETEEEESEEEEGMTADDLEEMNLKELKELATEHEVDFPKIVKAAKLREILTEELFSNEEEEDAEDDSTELDSEDMAVTLGLNEMSVEELAEILSDHGIKASGKKQALIARVLEAVEDGTIEVGEDDEEGE